MTTGQAFSRARHVQVRTYVAIVLATLALVVLALTQAEPDNRSEAVIANTTVGVVILLALMVAKGGRIEQSLARSVVGLGVAAGAVALNSLAPPLGIFVGIAALLMGVRAWTSDATTPTARAALFGAAQAAVIVGGVAAIIVATTSSRYALAIGVATSALALALGLFLAAGRVGIGRAFAVKVAAGIAITIGIATAGFIACSEIPSLTSDWRTRLLVAITGFTIAALVRIVASVRDSPALTRASLVLLLVTIDVARIAAMGSEGADSSGLLSAALLVWNVGFAVRYLSHRESINPRWAEPLRLIAVAIFIVAADISIFWIRDFLPDAGSQAAGKLLWAFDVGAVLMTTARWLPDRLGYVVRRLVLGGVTLLVVTLIAYWLTTLTPDVWWKHIVFTRNATPASIAHTEHLLGVDRPVFVQYLSWLNTVLQFPPDLGFSDNLHSSVSDVLVGPAGSPWFETRIGATIVLMGASYIVQLVIAIPAGIISAARPHTKVDKFVTTSTFMGISLPNYWLGTLLIYALGVLPYQLGWGKIFPVGSEFDNPYQPTFTNLLWHLVLPTIVLAVQGIAGYARFVRGAMLDVLSQDYIRTARAKGLSPVRVTLRHAFRNSLLPLITLLGIDLPALFVGAIVTEFVFNWPGMGQLSVQQINQGDTVTVIAIVLIFGALVVVGNLLADIGYTIADPRIKYDEA